MNLQKIRLPWFDIQATMESGQCFRWRLQDNDRYMGWIRGNSVELVQHVDWVEAITEEGVSQELIRDYFDADRDYPAILASWKGIEDLTEIVDRWQGIRILRQPLQETIISFILSQNNNIPRIQGMIERFCKAYGKPTHTLNGQEAYAFPTDWDSIDVTEEDLRNLAFGYRAKYVAAAIQSFRQEGYDEGDFAILTRPEQEKRLLDLMGIGPKVAACILLFALGDFSAFPMDVWVLRIMRQRYLGQSAKPKEIEAYAKEVFGEERGYLQQLLFHEYRMKEKKNEGSE